MSKMHFQPVEHSSDDVYLGNGGGGPRREVVNDVFEDVFGEEEIQQVEASHPSDMRRLETEHATAGYREGVNVGKQATLQRGFDEGYTMGAAIGLQAGQILGALQGIVEALTAKDGEVLGQAEKLLGDAKEELSVERLFNGTYWESNGEPSYEVDHDDLQSKQGGLAHPLIQQWTLILDQQVQVWHIDRTILDHINTGMHEPIAEETHDHPGQIPATRDPLDW